MRESGYYPPGVEFDPDAPWNQVDVEKKEFNITISQTLSKNTTVYTNDYVPGGYYPETEVDIDGVYTVTCYDPDDTSDTNWNAAYSEEHYTPLELIQLFKNMLENNISFSERERKHIIEECSEWVEDDLDICT